MAGEVWEVRPQASEQRPRTLFGGKKGSITWREERRPLLLPGDVRQLARDEQLVFVSGAKPLKTKKLRFDQEALLAMRLRRAAAGPLTLSTGHDWEQVAPLGMLPAQNTNEVRKPLVRSARPIAERSQGDLFAGERPRSISERAMAGIRPPPEPTPGSADPRRAAQRTGI